MKKNVIWVLCAALLIGGVGLLAGGIVGVIRHLPGRANDAEALFEEGVRYYREHRYEDSVVTLTKAIEKDSGHGKAYFYRGEANLAMAKNCQDSQKKLEYLALAEADYIRAQVLDDSVTAGAEERLTEIKMLREQSGQSGIVLPEMTLPEVEEMESDATDPKEDDFQDNSLPFTEPTEEQEDETTSDSVNGYYPGTSSSSSFSSSSSSSQPEHNPQVPPVSSDDVNPDEVPAVSIPPVSEEDSVPTDDPVIDNGEPPSEEDSSGTPGHNPQPLPEEPATPPVDTPEVDLGEPPVVEIPEPDHSPKPTPVDPEEE